MDQEEADSKDSVHTSDGLPSFFPCGSMQLRRRFHDTVHTNSADFPTGWELPTATALEAAVEKLQAYGYTFSDPVEAATLPAHVAEIVEGALPPYTT